jgi:hypothetical protein
MSGYAIVDHQKIDSHITFIRINPTDIALTLKEVFASLADLAWISAFDELYLREGFQVRAEASVKYIAENIIKTTDDSITSSSGEYVISELARKAVVDKLAYLDIPLAELIKIKDVGNHGFDFYTKNQDEIILFGEAKYNARQNAYGPAFEQIIRFEKKKQDSSDIIDIDRFCCVNSKNNFAKGHKGFIAAFASKNTSTEKLIEGITANTDYQEAIKFKELICVAVNI